jgi:hypothetical protein
MQDKPAKPEKSQNAKRLAAALRANLKRRKEAVKGEQKTNRKFPSPGRA